MAERGKGRFDTCKSLCKRGWDVEVALMLENKVEYPLDPKIKVIDLTQSSKSYVINLLPWVLVFGAMSKLPDRIGSSHLSVG
jgi:hypothetical protein